MKAKEFAELFGMSVSELADYTGYSRKTLYNIFSGGADCNDRRLKAMTRQLRTKAMIDLADEKTAADEKYMKRLRALESIRLEENMSLQQVN